MPHECGPRGPSPALLSRCSTLLAGFSSLKTLQSFASLYPRTGSSLLERSFLPSSQGEICSSPHETCAVFHRDSLLAPASELAVPPLCARSTLWGLSYRILALVALFLLIKFIWIQYQVDIKGLMKYRSARKDSDTVYLCVLTSQF